MANNNPYRLPRTIEPEHYELTLTPDIETTRFTGEERVRVTIHEETNVIRLNAVELEIYSAELINDDGVKLSGSVTIDETSEVATIQLSEPAKAGSWTLHLTFAGTLNDKLRGFYRSTYTDDHGQQHVIATTQFEATEARRAFPCWDEPDFKAVFAVTLIIDHDLTAFSNAGISEDTVLENGKRQVTFEDTMKMSTYLVAFIVGPLVVSDPVDVDGVQLRVACVPGREHLWDFALEAGAASLRYFSDYFKIPYPAQKLDLIALPDFAAGAMENLGCVTFRETALLVDTKRASTLEIQRVADVVAHEIAHMWFGDLVTMKWWNGLWLNEAFATFMEIKQVDDFKPDWKRWVSFGIEKSAAFSVDSLTNTRPIEYEVIKPEDADGMFDVLTYSKGAAVLRMLEQHLGDDEFARGISTYLKDNAYGNAETTDLWDALEATSGEPVRALMDSWIFQGGHPIVSAELSGNQLTLNQQRFRYSEDSEAKSVSWHIPVGIRAQINGQSQSQKVLLTGQSTTITFDSEPDWVVVNERGNGFFRVRYDSEMLHSLTEHLGELDSLERFGLVLDAWAASFAGLAPLKDVAKIVKVMNQDTDPDVWGVLLTPWRLVDKMVEDSDRANFERFLEGVLLPTYETLGWEAKDGESERTSTLRGVIISALGGLANNAEVQAEAEKRYAAFISDPSSLDHNLVRPVETVLAATGKSEHYETLRKKFLSHDSTPQEQINALQTLALFNTPELVEATLKMINDGEVRTQDAPYALRLMLSRRVTGPSIWEWCETNWADLTKRFPDNSISRMVDGISAHTDEALAERVQTFMAAHPVPQAQKAIDQTCETLRDNVAFSQREKVRLSEIWG